MEAVKKRARYSINGCKSTVVDGASTGFWMRFRSWLIHDLREGERYCTTPNAGHSRYLHAFSAFYGVVS
eukprot:IDg3026t1